VNPIKANKSQDFFVNFYWLFIGFGIDYKKSENYLFSLCCSTQAPSTTNQPAQRATSNLVQPTTNKNQTPPGRHLNPRSTATRPATNLAIEKIIASC
jgi:hypothetical protein